MAAQVIDQVIDELPIDQGFKDILQAGFARGSATCPAHWPPTRPLKRSHKKTAARRQKWAKWQEGVDDFRDTMEGVMQELVENILQNLREEDQFGGQRRQRRCQRRTELWLYAMAKVMGEKLDEMSDEMMTAAENIDKEDPSTTTRFTVLSQQFSIAANSASTGLKAVGEGLVGSGS